MAGHGTFSWNELMTRDVEAAKRFYAATLGRSYDAWPMPDGGTYWIARSGEVMVGGVMDISAPEFEGLAPNWFAYIEVDDVDARVAQVQSHDGRIMRPPFDVPEVGRIAIVGDPSGAVVGWMTPVARS